MLMRMFLGEEERKTFISYQSSEWRRFLHSNLKIFKESSAETQMEISLLSKMRKTQGFLKIETEEESIKEATWLIDSEMWSTKMVSSYFTQMSLIYSEKYHTPIMKIWENHIWKILKEPSFPLMNLKWDKETKLESRQNLDDFKMKTKLSND